MIYQETLNPIDCKKMSAMEKLFHQIFILDDYSSLVRPIDSNSVTNVQTELKLLQVDLV